MDCSISVSQKTHQKIKIISRKPSEFQLSFRVRKTVHTFWHEYEFSFLHRYKFTHAIKNTRTEECQEARVCVWVWNCIRATFFGVIAGVVAGVVVVKSKIMENGSMHTCHKILNNNYAYNDPTNPHFSFFAYSSPNGIIYCFPWHFRLLSNHAGYRGSFARKKAEHLDSIC